MLSLTGNHSKNLIKESNVTSGGFKVDSKYEKPKSKRNPPIDPDTLTKREIMDSIGIVNPMIEDTLRSTLENVNYKRKTKIEVSDEIVGDLEKQVEKLKFQRLKMLMKEDPNIKRQLKNIGLGVLADEQEKEEKQEKERQIGNNEVIDQTLLDDPDVKKVVQDPTIERIEIIMLKEKEKLLDLEKKYKEKREFEKLRSSSVNFNNFSSNPGKNSTISQLYDKATAPILTKTNFFENVKLAQSKMIPSGSPLKMGTTYNFNNTASNFGTTTYNSTGFKSSQLFATNANPLLKLVKTGMTELENQTLEIKKREEELANANPRVTISPNREYFEKIPEGYNNVSSDKNMRFSDSQTRNLIETSQKVRLIDPKKADWENKFNAYLTNKKLQETSQVYFESKEKKPFDRVKTKNSYEKYHTFQDRHRNHSADVLTHLPIDPNNIIEEQEEYEEELKNFDFKKSKLLNPKVKDINELFIMKLIFDAIDKDKRGFIKKEDAMYYITTNKDIVTIFEIKGDFKLAVADAKTEKPGFLNFKEFCTIMTKDLSEDIKNKITLYGKSKEKDASIKIHAPSRMEKRTADDKPEHVGTLLSPEEIQIFKEIFDSIDKMEDLVVSTETLMQALREDERIIAILDKPVLKIPIVLKELQLGQILDQIEVEYSAAFNDGLHTYDYISWDQFFNYFQVYKKPSYTRSQETQKGFLCRALLKKIQLPTTYIQIIQDLFDMLPRVAEDYVDTIEFVLAAKRDPQIRSFWDDKIASNESEKTIGNIFDDIAESSEGYLNWEDVLRFMANILTSNQISIRDMRSDKVVSKKTTQDFTTEPKVIQEVDSKKEESIRHADTQSKKSYKSRRDNLEDYDFRARPKDITDDLYEEYLKIQEDFKKYGMNAKNFKDAKGLTIPKPPKFMERDKSKEKESIRQKKVNEMIENKKKEEEDAINFKFKAKPIPAEVTTPLYENIKKTKEERRMELTEKYKAESQNRIQPFNFNESKKKKVEPSQELPSQFKANPVPAFVHVEEFKKKQDEEQKAREERKKQRAAEVLVSSKLPPRMEYYEKNKEEIKKNSIWNKKKYKEEEFDYKPKIKKEVPNFNEEQEKFMDDLKNKKAERPKTQVLPFSFQKTIDESVKSQEDVQSQKAKKSSQTLPKKEKTKSNQAPKKSTTTKLPDQNDQGDEQEDAQESGANENNQNEGQEGGGEEEAPAQSQQNDNQEISQKGSVMSKARPFLTKKLQAELDKKQKEKEEKQKKLEEEKRKLEEKKKREEEMTPKVNEKFNAVNKLKEREEENKRRKQEFLENQKKEQQDYQEKIKEMKARVEKTPLLVESKYHRSKFLGKYRQALAQEAANSVEANSAEENIPAQDQNSYRERADNFKESANLAVSQEVGDDDEEEQIEQVEIY